MRRKDKEITDINEIEEVIKKATHCRIGLVDNDEPYVVPVSFGYERGALYFHGASEGRKIELIKKNNSLCFEIDTDVEVVNAEKACNWTMKYRSVIGVGKARVLETDEEKSHGIKVLMEHYGGGESSISQSVLGSVSVVKVDINNITGKKSGY